ncbi:unnamed protein product [Acanthosepion pharaonis]|uniref:Uncharacterized protein n=1 Tax=Acanthosepion pharaonis TaxID=158019 RepID=A0A812BJM0_ACAPH|nr:unnamed protein product [Sepia pharaonis]
MYSLLSIFPQFIDSRCNSCSCPSCLHFSHPYSNTVDVFLSYVPPASIFLSSLFCVILFLNVPNLEIADITPVYVLPCHPHYLLLHFLLILDNSHSSSIDCLCLCPPPPPFSYPYSNNISHSSILSKSMTIDVILSLSLYSQFFPNLETVDVIPVYVPCLHFLLILILMSFSTSLFLNRQTVDNSRLCPPAPFSHPYSNVILTFNFPNL